MGKLVTPKVFQVGKTVMDEEGMRAYLEYTDQMEFWEVIQQAKSEGLSGAEILCSFFAKACYKSLTDRKNANISRVRNITGNLSSTFDHGHGSVFEHVYWNFMITDCSRVFTHELVRHRVGTAFSQTSGRYVIPVDENGAGCLDLVFDPILDSVKDQVQEMVTQIEEGYKKLMVAAKLDEMENFSAKKKLTSALRRVLPNGQSNEMGFSMNLRSVRQLVTLRTARFAEWEIRDIFGQIYRMLKLQHPVIFHGAIEKMIGGQVEVSGMKLQPWERMLSDYSLEELEAEILSRKAADEEQQE